LIEVVPVEDKKTFKKFFTFPFKIYPHHSPWVPPLVSDLKKQFSHRNPFFQHAEVAPFIATLNGEIAGRIVAIYNEAHINFHGEKTGFFGFFDCIDEIAIARALLDRAKQWLNDKGMSHIRGPMNFSSNEEWGLLVEGYDKPPMLMMPYNFPYYKTLLEACGMRKAKDLYAYIIDVPEKLPEKAYRVAHLGEKQGIHVRPLAKASFHEELSLFKNIYNSAWEKNWGYVPMTDSEIEYVGNQLKAIIVPELALIAEIKGKAVGFMMLLPDFNYVLKKIGGHLFPFGIVKALWYSRKIKNLRLLLLGVQQGYRRRGVDAFLFLEGLKAIKKGGYEKIEFSWILEDNYIIQRVIESFQGKLYKKYRIFEGTIENTNRKT
jgi:GNAT superfamily N-acetyltransferase